MSDAQLSTLTGSCLCGAVAYSVDAPPGPIVHCHCITCRKAHGSAFSSVMPVAREHFRWMRGEELLHAFESSPGKLRRFCSRCGSHVVAERPERGLVLLRLGCLDSALRQKPIGHIWRSEGASWYEPSEELPEFAAGFPT